MVSNFKEYISQFPEYNFELNQMYQMYKNIGLSRNILMVKKSFHILE